MVLPFRRIRGEKPRTPIVLLTVRAEDDDVVQGLSLGANDYIAKPFSPRQLVARVQAVLRRAGQEMAPAKRQIGSLIMSPDRREVRLGQNQVVT